MEYNTARNYLIMREYGRHIQRMVEYLLTIEDREKRQQQANLVVEHMGILNPHLKNVEDFRHSLWDHLFFISDFKLDVDSPYPIPEKETYKAKPDPLPYPKGHTKLHHLGKNIQMVIDKALNEEDPERKEGFANSIAYYMKLAYSNWHNELVHDDAIRSELNAITGGELEFSATPYIKHRPVLTDEFSTVRVKRKQNFNGRNTGGNANRQQAGNNTNRKNNNNGNSQNARSGGSAGRNASTGNRPGNFKKRF
jgi:hypothetical protein